MSSLLLGLSWYLPALVILSAIGLYLFDTEKRFQSQDIIGNILRMRGHLLTLISILLIISIINQVNNAFELGGEYTHLIYEFEGNTHIVWLQNSFQNDLFRHAISIFYILVFMWLLVFTTFFCVATNRKDVLRLFAHSLVLNYMVLLPFYVLFNVTVTSMYPANTPVQALLYDNDMYRSMIMMVGGFTDCFPSGHISVTVITTLVLFRKRNLRRFAYASLAIATLTGFAILYLGIHWFTDIIAGMLVGFSAFTIAQKPSVSKRLDRMTAWLERSIPVNYQPLKGLALGADIPVRD